MIFFVGKDGSVIEPSDFSKFRSWIKDKSIIQFDIETAFIDSWYERGHTVKSLQFGTKTEQFVLEFNSLNHTELSFIKEILEGTTLKLIHNAQFEYICMKFQNITLSNIYDTMIAEQILWCGYESKSNTLQSIIQEYLGIEISKELQKSFNSNSLSKEQIQYAATDVRYLEQIRDVQTVKLQEKNLLLVAALEMKVIPSLADMTYNGLLINKEKWLENQKKADLILIQKEKELDEIVRNDNKLFEKAKQSGLYSEQNCFNFNTNSLVSVRNVYKKYGIERDIKDKTKEELLESLLQYSLTDLIVNELYFVQDTLHINYSSSKQILDLARTLFPRIKSTSSDVLVKLKHPFTEAVIKYREQKKLNTAYGNSFLEKYVEVDDYVRSSYKQIVSTGRISSSKPNMQNIPANENVGNAYRNCFICNNDFVFVDGDYTSAELTILAFISKEAVWLNALKNGQDLHSICAELVFKDQWKNAAQKDCKFYEEDENHQPKKQKCSCKAHKHYRTIIKTISFGLCYGMGEMKLSEKLEISLTQARNIMEDYFKAFPKIKGCLNYLSNFGIQHGYSLTPKYLRKRFYPEIVGLSQDEIDYHLSGILYNKTLGEVGRQSSNHPIQGCNADITKYALYLVYRYIYSNHLQDDIKIVAQVHDQITTICKKELSEDWRITLKNLLEKAAETVIPNNLLKADVNISDCWTKN